MKTGSREIAVKSGLFGATAATVAAGTILLMFDDITGAHVGRTLSLELGLSHHMFLGWIAVVALGILLCGSSFALVAARVSRLSDVTKGLLLGFLIWLGLMLVPMPLSGAGMFGWKTSAIVPAVTLALTLAYGFILAAIFHWGTKQN